MLNKADIIAAVSGMALPAGTYWISAGAGLVMHGVKESTRDIDIGCTPELIDLLLQRGYEAACTPDGKRRVACGDVFEFFENWLAEGTEIIGEIPVASLASIKKQKLALGREKDFADIALIDAFVSPPPTDLRISDMLRMQRELWERHKDTWSPMEPVYARNSLLWMIEELGEVISIIKKRGEKDIAADPGLRSALVEELGDVAMFFCDVLLRYGVTASEFAEAYTRKHDRNLRRDFETDDSNYLKA